MTPARPKEGAWLLGCLAGAATVVAVFLVSSRGEIDDLVPPLDDTYIHFQYARSISEGHAFRYHPDDAPSSGATSPVYAFALALFHAAGLTGPSLYLAALVIGILCLGLAAYWLSSLAARLSSEAARLPVVVAILGWGWLTWHVASGMEGALALAVMAWIFDRAHRFIHQPEARTAGGAGGMILLCWLLPLIRPASVVLAGALAVTLFAYPLGRSRRGRALAILPLLALGVGRLFWTVVTGQAYPNGAVAKWLFLDPAKPPAVVDEWMLTNVGRLATFLFGVGPWVERFYGAPILFGLVVLLGAGWGVGRGRGLAARVWMTYPGAIVAVFVALMTYATYAQHFFRYTTPYIPLLLAHGIAATVVLVRAAARRWRWLRPRPAAFVVALLVGGSMITSWPYALPAFVGSTRDIAEQHVEMARELRRLPRGSVVAVTDTGALAYLGGQRTVDVIGLTTNGMSRYHLSGAGSQLESVEQLPARDRPTHWATYRSWWFMPSGLFGASIARHRASRPTIVGGTVMELWPADRVPFGLDLSERPVLWDPEGRDLLDAIDVADIRDEEAHDWRSSTLFDLNVYATFVRSGEPQLVDGGRRTSDADRFRLAGRAGRPMQIVLRVAGDPPSALRVSVNGVAVGSMALGGGDGWEEEAFPVEGRVVRADNRVVVERTRSAATTLHVWSYADP